MILSTYDSWKLSCGKEQDEQVVTKDLYGKELYLDSFVYDTGEGVVHESNMVTYLLDKNEMTTETGRKEFYDETIDFLEEVTDPILYDGYWLTADETYEFLAWRGINAIKYNDL